MVIVSVCHLISNNAINTNVLNGNGNCQTNDIMYFVYCMQSMFQTMYRKNYSTFGGMNRHRECYEKQISDETLNKMMDMPNILAGRRNVIKRKENIQVKQEHQI